MTTLLTVPHRPATPQQEFLTPRRRPGQRARSAAWPVTALLLYFPLWWALGLGAFAFPLFAVPMALGLWRRRGSLALPPGFLIWGCFLALNVVSLIMLPIAAPDTVAGTMGARALSLALIFAEYAAATITLLYIGNLTETELPQKRLVRMLGVLFVVTAAGGLLGVLAPNFGYTSPVELLLPGSVRQNLFVQALVHPSSAQIQTVLGSPGARPAAPFGYTNYWGNCLSLLVVWFVIWGWQRRSTARRLVTLAVLGVALVPVVQSLNRALWLGLAISVVYLAVQLAARGRGGALLAIGGLAVIGMLVFSLTPLHDTVSQRLASPGSTSLRGFLSSAAIDGAERSPVVGWGGARRTVGSVQSINVGATPGCPQCGNFPIGSNGQLWYVLFSQGFLGAALFIGFFLRTGLRYLRRRDPLSSGAALVLILGPVYAVFYNDLPAALTITFISLAIAWRQERLLATVPAPASRSAGASAGTRLARV